MSPVVDLKTEASRVDRGAVVKRRAQFVLQPEKSSCIASAGAGFARLVEIAEALDLTIHHDVRLASAG